MVTHFYAEIDCVYLKCDMIWYVREDSILTCPCLKEKTKWASERMSDVIRIMFFEITNIITNVTQVNNLRCQIRPTSQTTDAEDYHQSC